MKGSETSRKGSEKDVKCSLTGHAAVLEGLHVKVPLRALALPAWEVGGRSRACKTGHDRLGPLCWRLVYICSMESFARLQNGLASDILWRRRAGGRLWRKREWETWRVQGPRGEGSSQQERSQNEEGTAAAAHRSSRSSHGSRSGA